MSGELPAWSRDPHVRAQKTRITPSHALASAAIPLLFPTRRIGAHYYCDGGLRFNTPIAPAIRAGAERLVIVSVRHERSQREVAGGATEQYLVVVGFQRDEHVPRFGAVEPDEDGEPVA